MHAFDPHAVGERECRAWETYYRREWRSFLVASVGLVRAAFGMSWPRTLLGAWLVLRANQVWAPYPDNDPAAARRLMARFYRLLREQSGGKVDPRAAAWLEVEWWRAHREHQRAGAGPGELVDALRDLYAYAYAADAGDGQAGGAPARGGHGRVRRVGGGGLRSRRSPAWPRSGRCWCAPTRRCWPRCTAEEASEVAAL